MKVNVSYKNHQPFFTKVSFWANNLQWEKVVFLFSLVVSVLATLYSYIHGYVIVYGDAESHLNIAKRVVDSLTPGMAQLGGIWLPLPHLLMVPFVAFDPLWRTGLAGSIVSGVAFVTSCVFLFKLMKLLTHHLTASLFAVGLFAFNPSVLYIQSTPMTEMPLIALFIVSTYFFVKFVKNPDDILSLILAAFFGFLATLTRYDGWFLVLFQAAGIIVVSLSLRHFRNQWSRMEGKLILYSTLAFFGILLWFVWDWLILGDPLYFTHSEFSAKSQQSQWLARGELPAYQNLVMSFLYYLLTTMSTTGILVFSIGIAGLFYFLFVNKYRHRFLIALIAIVPFIFYVVTLYMGQSVIFLPSITPKTFEWQLFNVRYGLMMVPVIALFAGYLYTRSSKQSKVFLLVLATIQIGLFAVGYSKNIVLEDGLTGLSAAKNPDAQRWMAENYDYGLVLLDDYARTLSVVKSNIPMENVIYIGNKPYWEESFIEPEKYARWIIMQKDDQVWKHLNDDPAMQGRLFKYFHKVYTSEEILIFRRSE